MKTRIPPPIVALLAAGLMWAVARYIPFEKVHVPAAKWILITAIFLGLFLTVWAIKTFRAAQTTVNPRAPEKATVLVMSGPYSFTRNPMYLGLALYLFGWGIWLSSPLNILTFLAVIFYLSWFQIKPEEAAMTANFGMDYEAYRARVRRWV